MSYRRVLTPSLPNGCDYAFENNNGRVKIKIQLDNNTLEITDDLKEFFKRTELKLKRTFDKHLISLKLESRRFLKLTVLFKNELTLSEIADSMNELISATYPDLLNQMKNISS